MKAVSAEQTAPPTPPAQGVVRKVLVSPCMLRELVFLSITVLRPHVAKNLTTKYGINSLRGRVSELLHWDLD